MPLRKYYCISINGVAKAYRTFLEQEKEWNNIVKWESAICRCCLEVDEDDTFHYFIYTYRQLKLEKKTILDNIFAIIDTFEYLIEIKELIFQFLSNFQEYSPLSHLEAIYQSI